MTSKKLTIRLLPLAMPLAGTLQAATVTSIATGEWDAAATWSSGVAAPVTGTEGTGDDYVVAALFTVTSNDTNSNAQALIGKSLTVQSGGVLDLARIHGSTTQVVAWNLPPISLEDGAELQVRASLGTNNHTIPASLTVAGSTLIDNTGGGYGQNIDLTGSLSGSGTLTYKTADSGSAVTTRTLALKSAASAFTGDWFLQHVNSGNDFGMLRADAANALGSGTVTVDTRAQLSNNVAGGFNSLSGIILQQSTSSVFFNGYDWTNPAGILTHNDGTANIGTSQLSIASLTQANGAINLTVGGSKSGKLTTSGDADLYGGIINIGYGGSPVGKTFDLITYGGSLVAAPVVEFGDTGRLIAQVDNGDGSNDKVTLSFTGSVANLTWLGNEPNFENDWDNNVATNWSNGGSPDKFRNFDNVTFGNTSGSTTPTLIGSLLPGSVTFNHSTNDYTLGGTGTIDGGATLTKSGSGTLTLSGAHGYLGNITINGGKLVTGNAGSLGGAGNKTVTVNAGGQLDFNGISPGTSRAYSYRITGTGADGNGALTNSSANSVGSNSGIQNLELLGNATLGGAGRFDIARVGSTSGAITGNGHTLTKVGANQIQLRGDATNLAAVVVNEGTLGVEDSDLALGGAAGSATVNNGAALGAYGARTIATPVRLNAGATLLAQGGAAATWGGPLTLGGNATISLASQSMNITGNIGQTGGAFGFTKTGGNTLTLSGNNSFTGGIVIDNGIVTATTTGALGSGPVTVGDTSVGGTTRQLKLSGVTVPNNIVSKYMYTGDYKGTLTAVGGSVSTVNGSVTIHPAIAGASSRGGHLAGDATAGSVLRLMGPLDVADGQTAIIHRDGVVEYGGGSSTSYTLNVTNTARLAANNGIGSGVHVALGQSGGATLDLNGFSTTIAGLTRSGNTTAVTNSAAGASTLTLDTATDLSYNGGINDGSGGVSLVKKGSGTYTLAAATGYTGATSVEGGTLVINATTGATPVTVTSGATLGGTGGGSLGGINGSIAVAGTLAPGNTVGEMYTNGSVTFAPGSTYAWEVADWTGTAAGTGWDLVNSLGLAFTATPANKLTIAVSGTAANFSETAKTFEIARSFDPVAGFNPAAIQIDDSAFTGTGTWSVQANGNSIELVYTPGSGNPFSTWASTNGVPADAALDSDGDGIPNGIEFVIGGDPSGPDSASNALLPTITTDATYLNFTFRRTDEAAGMSQAQQPYVQYGSALSGWTKAEGGVDGVVISEVNGTPDLVTVKIPRTLAANGKLFARLKVDIE